MASHEGVSCDGCNATAFSGNRYKCLRCGDYDLCFACFTEKRFGDQPPVPEIAIHDETHPMQLMLTPQDFDAVYEGDPTRRYEDRKIVSFTCPYCNITGLTDRQFGHHVTAMHTEPSGFGVICPLCIAIGDFDHNTQARETENLCAHWNDVHSNLLESSFRADTITTTRPAQRRPMLARRTQRAAGNRNALAGARLMEDLGPEMAELIRAMRPEAMDDTRRADLIGRNQRLINDRRELGTREAEIERRTIVFSDMMRTVQARMDAERREHETLTADTSNTHQVIRPLPIIPIYPPTSDDSGDETPQPAADSADECEHENWEEKMKELLMDQNSPKIEVSEDEELKNDDFWKIVKSRLSDDEVRLILESMKTSAKPAKEKEEKMFNLKTRIPKMTTTLTSADSEGDQGWMPLQFETTPLRSTGCGGYWSDKRFLRPRKMQREQSVASSNAEILEKAEVAMAIFRAASDYEPRFSDPSKPDISLKEALNHLNLGEKPSKMMEYQAADEPVQMPERDPITTGDEPFEMPDFTARGYGQIIDGNTPLGVVPEADEAVTNSEDDEDVVGETTSSDGEEDEEQEEEDDDDDDDDDDDEDSSIPDEINIIS